MVSRAARGARPLEPRAPLTLHYRFSVIPGNGYDAAAEFSYAYGNVRTVWA